MARYTLVRQDSAIHQAFTELHGSGTIVGPNLVVYSFAWSQLAAEDPDLFQSVKIDPVFPVDESPVPPVVFDIDSEQPQEMSLATLRQLMREQPGLFTQPSEEAPEPRYKTRLSSLEFVDLIGDALEVAIYTAAQGSIDIQRWKDRVFGADFVDLVADERIKTGLDALKAAGIMKAADVNRIMLGKPY